MVRKKCELCGGALDYQRSDAQGSCYKCPYCGELYLISAEGHGNPLQYSCLENPVGREAWWAAVHGVAQSRT